MIKERDYLPQVALGIRDIAGTGTFAAEYLVASKQIKIPKYFNGHNYLTNVDLTFGLGWGDLSYSKFTNPLKNLDASFERRTLIQNTQGGEFSPGRYFSGPMGAFAGVEIPLPNLSGLKLKIEYDGTDYSEEGFPFGRKSFQLAFESIKQSQSRINYGLTYPVNNYIQVYGAFTKGNTLSFGFTLAAGFGNKNPVIKSTEKLKSVDNPILRKELADGDDETLLILAMDVLRKNDIHVSKGSRNGEVLKVAYAQNKYMSHAMASGRSAQALDQVSPDYIKTFNEDDYTFNPPFSYPYVFWRIEPDIVAQIGGPDGFFFGNARLAGHAEFKFSRSISLNTEASIGIYDNFDELKLASDSVLPHVRTDIVKYLKATRDYSINRFQLNYFLNPRNDLYAKISGGLLEDMFGGIGGEVLYRPMHRNFAIGAEVWSVRQRDYNMNFSFMDYTTDTGHINLYYREPRSKVTLAVKGGRFLAGDSGVNIDFSRRFKSGLRIGAFFSLTDISKEEFGEGSFDKGFYFNIPMQAFFTNYSRSLAGWGLKPLTRDGAAYVTHSHHLWGITEPAQAYSIERDWDDLYD